MAKLHLISLGCNKNLVDSEIMLGKLQDYEITQNVNQADVIIINTCGFINSAKQESINIILNIYKEKKEDALLVVTGCLIQRYKQELMKELKNEVDLFAGLGDFAQIDELIAKKQNSNFDLGVFLQANEKRIITSSSYHAYIKISEGCNQTCSFCAIPSFKGKLKSRLLEDIIQEVKDLVSKGYYDFSFIAQDTSSYLRDYNKKDGLIELINEVEKIKGVQVARILYLYPSSTSMELIKRIEKSEIFVNYFDMPIQHISDNMLNKMRRQSSKKQLIELLHQMKNTKNSFLRTGIIIGHPYESDADFDELCEFLNEFAFDRISVFAYSKEENTPSFSMPQIPKKVINSRIKIIEKITKKHIYQSLQKNLGKKILVSLNGVSQETNLLFSAKPLNWDRDIDGEILINESDIQDLQSAKIYECQIVDIAGNNLIGKILKEN